MLLITSVNKNSLTHTLSLHSCSSFVKFLSSQVQTLQKKTSEPNWRGNFTGRMSLPLHNKWCKGTWGTDHKQELSLNGSHTFLVHQQDVERKDIKTFIWVFQWQSPQQISLSHTHMLSFCTISLLLVPVPPEKNFCNNFNKYLFGRPNICSLCSMFAV